MIRLAAILLFASAAFGAEAPPGAEECAACHEEGRRTGRREAGTPPPFDAAALRASPHGALECRNCHNGIAQELPHADKLAPVDCAACHPDQQAQYGASLHGLAARRGDRLAPGCKSCHGGHNVRSPVSVMEIPRLCGSCHREGTPVSLTREIPQENILGNYTDSIHGEGLFRRGLTVTAVCTSCHTAHSVLPHTDARSSISKKNIPKTCTRCHAQIETVHRKVIRGELWEKQPHMIPACVDCHEPHKVRRVFYPQGMSDRDCQRCHGDASLALARGGRTVSLFVNENELRGSRHTRVACVQCHTGGTPSLERPCSTMPPKVDCSICHAEVVNQYRESTHGQLLAQGSPDAPLCADCHATHGTKGKNDSSSSTFARNIPNLCGSCHRTGRKAAMRNHSSQLKVVENYRESIHGKGLLESGLTVTADCTDCHSAHHVLPGRDPRSSVNARNISRTCAQCHRGIFEQFAASVHSAEVTKTGRKLPVCSECHTAHTIQRTDLSNFRLHIMEQCGRCHEEITNRYFETFHGKVSRLGYLKTAKCYDCHGAHNILPVDNPRSMLSRANVVQTCGKCHTNSNRQFAGYLTHATHHDPVKYPFLFYTFWFMTSLLVVTLVLSGAHTLAWLPRSLQYRRELRQNGDGHGNVYVRRFDPLHRNLHLMVVSSFLGLALTGMILKFSFAPWAKVLARLLGGFEAAGLIHRFCAVLTFTYFAMHLYDLARRFRRSGQPLRTYVLGPDSMMFNRQDWRDFAGSMKWFFGKGPRPAYGRWTYWEKFDYFAVFWGVFVIGGTGLLLWFPEFFTRLLPGWTVNVATTIHSDEALLAVSFIFVVHFFNTHFRPEKFPMDPVVFTCGMPLEEFKRDRPREYRALVESGQLEARLMPAPPEVVLKLWRRFGFAALAIGLSLIVLIVYAMIFSYR